MPSPLAYPLTPFVDPVPLPARRVVTEPTRLTVGLYPATHRFHRDLPPSRVWAYDGLLPGPSIEVRRGVPLEVDWRNELEGTLPVVVTVAPNEASNGIPVQCLPGLSGGAPDPNLAALPGWAVVHFHGGVTPAAFDGWTENLMAPGQHTLNSYPNDQRGALLWYHDHVMGVTRYTVYAGLAGLWIVRDERERALGLPEGPPYEVPLLLADRNFDLDDRGHLTGQLVHKTDPGTMECFGPFTTVNGAVWPVLEVEPTTYRLRLLNGSNARTFRLVLVRDGVPDFQRVTQIGNDGGLLAAPVALPNQGLVLASAERADLLVDFSDVPQGTEFTLLNTAPAPFDGTFVAPTRAGQADLPGLLPYPEVLRLRVVAGRAVSRPSPAQLATDIQTISEDELASCMVRAIALVEQELEGQPSMLTLRELANEPDVTRPVLTLIDTTNGQTQHVSRLRTVATRFEDTVTFFPVLGQPEIWRLINLTRDTHPIHVHLSSFRVLHRWPAIVELPADGITSRETNAVVRLGDATADDGIIHTLDANEQGLKDTVRVNPREVVDIVVRFEPYAGRYMYHCHILEHEDRDMMRPFVVTPAELMPAMDMAPGRRSGHQP